MGDPARLPMASSTAMKFVDDATDSVTEETSELWSEKFKPHSENCRRSLDSRPEEKLGLSLSVESAPNVCSKPSNTTNIEDAQSEEHVTATLSSSKENGSTTSSAESLEDEGKCAMAESTKKISQNKKNKKNTVKAEKVVQNGQSKLQRLR